MKADLIETKQDTVVSVRGANEVARAAEEVKGAIFMARQFPRDQTQAFERIMSACKRRSLAENSQYQYPKGGANVTGPSIRLAEVLAQNWGNIDFGIKELERRNGESTMQAYCWDLEANTRRTIEWTVRHIRERSESKGGSMMLTGERDVYEVTANQAARRMRACILAVIPGDIVEEAIRTCNETLKGDHAEPIGNRARRMVESFKEYFQVTQEMIEDWLGHKVEVITELKLAELKRIFQSLRDEVADRETFFKVDAAGTPAKKTKAAKSKASLVEEEEPPKQEAEQEADDDGIPF